MALDKDFRVKNGLTVASTLTVSSNVNSISTTTGAAIVTGGLAVGRNIFAGGSLYAGLTADSTTTQYSVYYNPTTKQLTTATSASGSSTGTTSTFLISNTTSATSTSTGALQVRGGVGIAGSVFVGGTIYGNIVGTVTTSTVAASADKWTTARTVTFTGDTTGTFSIDGSSNVSNVTLTIQPNSVALGTDTTGDYVSTGATSGFGISGSTTGETQTFTVTANSTSANTVSTIVYRDGSGNFSAGTINANIINAGTGTALGGGGLVVNGTSGDNDSQIILKKPSQSGFGITAWDGEIFLSANTYYLNGVWTHSAPSGDNFSSLLVFSPQAGVKWYASNNGSTSFNIAAAKVLWDNNGAWASTLTNALTLATSGTGLSGSATYTNSGATTFTVTSNATNTNTAGAIVARDASGNFVAGFVTATNLSISSTTAATSTSTGALQVAGGVGIAGKLFVGTLANTTGSNIVYYNASTGELSYGANFAAGGGGGTTSPFSGIFTITNTTQASSTVTGALQVRGGVGIGGNVYASGLYSNGTQITPFNSQEFTAASGQSIFTVTNGYIVGQVQVYANGLLLASGDYTASNGTSVTVLAPRRLNDTIKIISGNNVGFSTQQAYSFIEVVATSAGQTTFTANYNTATVQVFIDGVLRSPTTYTASNGTSIILSSGSGIINGTRMGVLSFNSISISGALSLSGGTVNGTLNVNGSLQQNGQDVKAFSLAMSVAMGI